MGRGGSRQEDSPSRVEARIKISVNTDISVIGFYGNIGKISVKYRWIFLQKYRLLNFFIF